MRKGRSRKEGNATASIWASAHSAAETPEETETAQTATTNGAAAVSRQSWG
jgi:hypothetical protein